MAGFFLPIVIRFRLKPPNSEWRALKKSFKVKEVVFQRK